MFGFYRLAAAVPRVYLADTASNTAEIIKCYQQAAANGAAVVLFPEMCITGYTIGDLVFQKQLLNGARNALIEIAEATLNNHTVAIVGLPMEYNGRLYNCAAVVQNGVIAGIVPKQQLVNYREYSEKRFFASGRGVNDVIMVGAEAVSFAANLLFDSGDFAFGVEICEDLWSVTPPPDQLALAIVTGDEKSLTAAQGIGKKIAQRIILELKDKLAGTLEAPSGGVSAGVAAIPAAGSAKDDAIAALIQLGYSRSDAMNALQGVDAAGKSMKRVWTVLYVPCPYTFYERVKLEVAAWGGIIRDTQFGAEVELEILVPEAQAEPFLAKLIDMSAANVEGMETGKEYRAFPVE